MCDEGKDEPEEEGLHILQRVGLEPLPCKQRVGHDTTAEVSLRLSGGELPLPTPSPRTHAHHPHTRAPAHATADFKVYGRLLIYRQVVME